eukprot:scaffold20944_cov56-Phaeocystis_antarctica.AAC.5
MRRCAVASLPQNLSPRERAPPAWCAPATPLHPTHRGAEACRGRSAVGAAQLQLLPHRAASLHLHGDLPALDTALDVPREEAWVRSPPPHTHGLAPGVSQSALFGLVYKASVIGAPCTHTPGSTDVASEQRARASQAQASPLCGKWSVAVAVAWWRGGATSYQDVTKTDGPQWGSGAGWRAAVSSMRSFPPAAWRAACTRAVTTGPRGCNGVGGAWVGTRIYFIWCVWCSVIHKTEDSILPAPPPPPAPRRARPAPAGLSHLAGPSAL